MAPSFLHRALSDEVKIHEFDERFFKTNCFLPRLRNLILNSTELEHIRFRKSELELDTMGCDISRVFPSCCTRKNF
jgi:hypothetical protein